MQLAEALKLSKIKRPSVKKEPALPKPPAEKPPELQEKHPEPVREIPPPTEKAPPSPPPAEKVRKVSQPTVPHHFAKRPPGVPQPIRRERPPISTEHRPWQKPARPPYAGPHRPHPHTGFAKPGGAYPRSPRPPLPSMHGPSTKPPIGKEVLPKREMRFTEYDFESEKRKATVREPKNVRKPPREGAAFDSRDRLGLRDELEGERWRKKRPSFRTRVPTEEPVRPKQLKIRLPITVKELAQEMKLKASELVANLLMKGIQLTLNDRLDDETTVQLLGHDFGCTIEIDTNEESRIRITDKTIKQEIESTPAENLQLRPPVVAFMGHVDHGKTSLIDAIRKSNLTAGEKGAITQHIGAFCCRTEKGNIAILDTPGHEAFSAMRSRGADITDLVVLVIAGDEGIRDQTIEAIQQAKEANVSILVAINKLDKPGFNAENVYRQLSEHELLPEAWGGQTITVNCSATTGSGITELVEMLALQAEILELKANPHTRARGTIIESEMHKGFGPVATVLVQNGTLKLGDALVFAHCYGRVKTMHDEMGNLLQEAGPSTPVKITGLSDLPEAGTEFISVKDEKEAKELSEKRVLNQRYQVLTQAKRKEGWMNEDVQHKKVLNLMIRGDVQGSVEALRTSLLKLPSQKVELNILSADVGEITESDIELAQAASAALIGFHTRISRHAEIMAKEKNVLFRLHDIIYHAVDNVKEMMIDLLDKIPQETDTGLAEVKATFRASQLGVIAGCSVTQGSIKRSSHVRLLRQNEVVWKGTIASLKRVKEDVREVSKGMECGILLHNFNETKVGDVIQAYDITYLTQSLE